MSGRALKELIESGETRELSMGCKVEQPSCTICGDADPCEHVEEAYKRYGELEGVRLISVGLVEAPKCEACGDPMDYTGSATFWACVAEGCPELGVRVNPGFGGLVVPV
jgi:hypothetical protein